MATVIRGGFIDAPDIVACFVEAPGGGNIRSINSPCNAPALNPELHLDKVIWHPALFQWELAFLGDVTIDHTSLAGKTVYHGVSITQGVIDQTTPVAGVVVAVNGDVRVTDIALANHGVGMIPITMVAYNGRMLPSGYIIQSEASGQLRTVAPWVDGATVFLRETAVSSDIALPAASYTYSVIVFRTRDADPAKPLWTGGPGADMELARGVIDSGRRYAKQVAPGDSPFSVNMGPTIDIANGMMRTATGGVVVTESGYNGSLVAPPFISIGV